MTHPTRPPITDSIVFTYTDDLDATSAFFADTLELDLVVDQGACHIYRLTESSYLGVCDLPDRPMDKAALTITLVVDDVDGWYESLSTRGVRFERAPAHSERFGVYSALFFSPNGYRIEIQSFDDEGWSRKARVPSGT